MYLLSRSSNVNLQDNDGFTPLHFAAMQTENTYIADKLLRRGADPRIPCKEGFDAIEAARKKGFT